MAKTDIEQIYLLKREVVELRRAVAPLSVELRRIHSDHKDLLSKEVLRYMRDVIDHQTPAADRIASYDEMLSSLVQAALAKVGMQQNTDMRKISAWVAIAAVPTMIAGVYGMNFEHMPELSWSWGYPAVLLLMVCACAVPVPQFPPQPLAVALRRADRRAAFGVGDVDAVLAPRLPQRVDALEPYPGGLVGGDRDGGQERHVLAWRGRGSDRRFRCGSSSTALNGGSPAGRSHSGEPRSISASATRTTPSTAGVAASTATVRARPGVGTLQQADTDFGPRTTQRVDGERGRVPHRMARTPQRHIMQRPVDRAEPQHIDAFHAQERHARRIRLAVNTFRGEVPAQVCPYLVETSRQSGTTAGSVRFAPESASKATSFVVSRASSTVWPTAARDSVETRATNSIAADAGVGRQFGEMLGLRSGARRGGSGRTCRHPATPQFDLDRERERADPPIPVDHRGILEMLRADTDDDVARRGVHRDACRTSAGSARPPRTAGPPRRRPASPGRSSSPATR